VEAYLSLNLEKLASSKKKAYKSLLKESYHCLFKGKKPEDRELMRFVAIGYEVDEAPLGIALMAFFETIYIGELLTLHAPSERAVLELLQRVKETMLSLRCLTLTFTYDENHPQKEWLEHSFAKEGWLKPRLYFLRYTFKAAIFNPPWLSQVPPLYGGFKIIPWSHLTSEDREHLMERERQGRVRSDLAPSTHREETIEVRTSFVLKKEEEIIGWILTTKEEKESLNYSSFFIDLPFRGQGMAITLLAAAIQEQKRLAIPIAFFEINLDKVPRYYEFFIQKRLAPYAQTKVMRFQTSLNL
jgi:predicted GNAT family acetyltransferase